MLLMEMAVLVFEWLRMDMYELVVAAQLKMFDPGLFLFYLQIKDHQQALLLAHHQALQQVHLLHQLQQRLLSRVQSQKYIQFLNQTNGWD